jgi:membrane protease YdiL (CAAX protease family)
MAVSVLRVPLRAAPASFCLAALGFAAAIGGAEIVYRRVGPFWGAVCFAAVFLALVHLAELASARMTTRRGLTALLAAASLVPLERLLVLSAPSLSYLRLYPNALWLLPMGLVTIYAYRAHWFPETRPWLCRLPGPGWRPFAIQATVAAAGAVIGVLASYIVPHTGYHVLFYPDTAKWIGVALFSLAGVVEELAWRGVLQPFAAGVAGPVGILASTVASVYVSVAWMGPGAVVPMIALSAMTSVVVYRTRCLAGSMAAHGLMNLFLVMLR